MATEQPPKSLERQHDPFTFFVAICFTCIVTALAHGYFTLAAHQEMGQSMRIFRRAALYVLPGLAAGFVWPRWWGVLVGAGIGAAVRVLSLVNRGFIRPFVLGEASFSFDAAVQSTSPFLLYVAASVATGVAAAGAGWVLAIGGPDEKWWYHWLRKLGVGILFLGFILAGGAWLYGFLPLKDTRGLDDKMEYISGIAARLATPVTILLWAGMALTAVCLTIALAGFGVRAGSQTAEKDA
jgi:hypothetical protein